MVGDEHAGTRRQVFEPVDAQPQEGEREPERASQRVDARRQCSDGSSSASSAANDISSEQQRQRVAP